ncbi:unnamed protein product [Rhizophagus irregularis]|nr:unnamed protein product [Rhizophagus irregularis]
MKQIGAEQRKMKWKKPEFLEMRKNLKTFFDAIYNIDEQLFTSYVHTAVINTLDKYQRVGNSIDWRELELAYTYCCWEMVSKMIQCNISTYPHPSMPLIFFENVARYYQFFEVQPDCIPTVLGAFVDLRGLHNAILQIQTVLTNIQDLLVVQANLSSIDSTTIPTERQTEFAKIVINPLLADIERNLSKVMSEPEDLLHVLQLHHLIIAIGSIGKGFPDALKRSYQNFLCFKSTPSGTDEAMLLLNLRKAYLGFILSLLNVGMDAVFISDLNQPRLESILQSVVHYASDPADVPSARTAFNILSKTLVLWGGPIQSSTNNTSTNSGRPLPGFEQFMYDHILRICFEVPMKPEFCITDGQSNLILNEISSILKTMYSLRGHELLDYLRRVWLPLDSADEFLQALQQLELKEFRKYFQTYVQRSKS